MLRLLTVTTCLKEMTGAEKWQLDTFRRILEKEDVHIDYFAYEGLYSDIVRDRYSELNIDITACAIPRSYFISPIKVYHILSLFLESRERYDAIHINSSPLNYQIAILAAAEKAGIPCRIVHTHNFYRDKSNFLERIYQHIIEKKCTVFGSCSELAGCFFYGEIFKKSPKSFIFRNGIDTYSFAYSSADRKRIRKELNIPDSSDVMIHIGRFSKQKNQLFMLDVFSEYIREYGDAVLILIGEGELSSEISKRIEELGIEENIRRISTTPNPAEFLSAADVFILPSIHEGLPYVLVEAQCNGLPSVVSEEGVTKEADIAGIVDYESIYKDNAIGRWVSAIRNILVSKDSCSRVGYEKIIREKGYDIETTAAEFLSILKGGC